MIPFLLLCAVGTVEMLCFGHCYAWLMAFGVLIGKGMAAHFVGDLPKSDRFVNRKSQIVNSPRP